MTVYTFHIILIECGVISQQVGNKYDNGREREIVQYIERKEDVWE